MVKGMRSIYRLRSVLTLTLTLTLTLEVSMELRSVEKAEDYLLDPRPPRKTWLS